MVVKLLVGMMIGIAAMGWAADHVHTSGDSPVQGAADQITRVLEQRTEVTCAAAYISTGVEECGVVTLSPAEVLELAREQ